MPENCRELVERIGQFELVRKIYVGHCDDGNGGIALMFMGPKMRQPLMECKAFFGDGTFNIRPRDPPNIAQIYIFHIMRYLSLKQQPPRANELQVAVAPASPDPVVNQGVWVNRLPAQADVNAWLHRTEQQQAPIEVPEQLME
uniref:Uncharacterized protein n=1 Tax=Trichogramma kaykai TaxID=54128 RepID=A0ABD2W711_9HYME